MSTFSPQWIEFFANSSRGLLASSRAAKLRFLHTSLCTIARFRWSRWPYTHFLARQLDAHQRKFLYRLFPVRPGPDEPMHAFYQRRHRAACRLAGSIGKWSDLWATDLRKWRAHVKRAHDAHAWSPKVLDWHGRDWLDLQRSLNSAIGESRTNTRAFKGCVHRRWEDGIDVA